jgi:hypothetical protein
MAFLGVMSLYKKNVLCRLVSLNNCIAEDLHVTKKVVWSSA